jgi:hypothetical protein
MKDELAAITRSAPIMSRRLVPRQSPQHGERKDDCNHAEREIPQEDHRPVQMIGDPSAESRPRAARGRKSDREIGVIFAAILGRGDVAEDHIGSDGQAAGAAALHHAAADQHQHVRRRRTDERSGHIDAEPDQHRGAAAVDVGEFAVKRGERRRGDQERRDQPRQIMHFAETAADGRQCTGEDRLIDRTEEDRQHHANDDQPLFPVRERRRAGGRHCRHRSRRNAMHCNVVGGDRLPPRLNGATAALIVHEAKLRCNARHAALPAEHPTSNNGKAGRCHCCRRAVSHACLSRRKAVPRPPLPH